jgi:hypothetical protein
MKRVVTPVEPPRHERLTLVVSSAEASRPRWTVTKIGRERKPDRVRVR